MPTLTDRQAEIAQLTALGLTQKEIAAHLGLEYSTIRNHRQRIYRILGVHNMIEMLRALVGDNGIDPEEDDDEE